MLSNALFIFHNKLMHWSFETPPPPPPPLIGGYPRHSLLLSVKCCLLPRPHYSVWPKCFRSRGPSRNGRPRQKSSKLRQKWDSSCGCLQDHCFTFQGLKIHVLLKDTDGKGKFKRMLTCSFLLVDKGGLFFTKLSFKKFEIHNIFITADLPVGLFWNATGNATKQRSFGEFSSKFCTV